MNPMKAMANRTARLVSEASTPVYSTETKPYVREHRMVVEVESGMGRYWSKPMNDSEVNAYCDNLPASYGVSDVDCSVTCWCAK